VNVALLELMSVAAPVVGAAATYGNVTVIRKIAVSIFKEVINVP
jgi:hypothetical protein